LNTPYFLNATVAFDDDEPDVLSGSLDTDWFLLATTDRSDRIAVEVVTNLG
jgi:hypothetical protein